MRYPRWGPAQGLAQISLGERVIGSFVKSHEDLEIRPGEPGGGEQVPPY
jgi:hypothetical protein